MRSGHPTALRQVAKLHVYAGDDDDDEMMMMMLRMIIMMVVMMIMMKMIAPVLYVCQSAQTGHRAPSLNGCWWRCKPPVGAPADATRPVLEFIGAHRAPLCRTWAVAWSAARHCRACGPSCGCCRAASEDDYPTGYSCCLNLWIFRCTCREARARLRMYNGQ